MAAAETGSGKTGAFALPVLQVVQEVRAGLMRTGAPTAGRGAATDPAPAAAVWNAADRDDALAIQPDGLVCQSRSEAAWSGVRASLGADPASGPRYFEVAVCDEGLCRVGWAAPASSLELGTEKGSWGYGGTGRRSHAGAFEPYGRPYGLGDVVGAALDWQARRLSFYLNGKDLGVAYDLPKVGVMCRGVRWHAPVGEGGWRADRETWSSTWALGLESSKTTPAAWSCAALNHMRQGMCSAASGISAPPCTCPDPLSSTLQLTHSTPAAPGNAPVPGRHAEERRAGGQLWRGGLEVSPAPGLPGLPARRQHRGGPGLLGGGQRPSAGGLQCGAAAPGPHPGAHPRAGGADPRQPGPLLQVPPCARRPHRPVPGGHQPKGRRAGAGRGGRHRDWHAW